MKSPFIPFHETTQAVTLYGRRKALERYCRRCGPNSKEAIYAKERFRLIEEEKRPCAICGSRYKLNAHHTIKEDPYSLIVLCESCHSKVHGFPVGSRYKLDRDIKM